MTILEPEPYTGLPDPDAEALHLTDDELGRWLEFDRIAREEEEFLTWLEADDPEFYQQISDELSAQAVAAAYADWRDPRDGFGARPEQLIPGTPGSFSDRVDWFYWVLMGGRGSGKSRTGAEAVREYCLGREWNQPNPYFALVGKRLDDVRVNMVENTLLKILPPGSVRKWNRGTCELWLSNGCYLRGFSSAEPDNLRGPNLVGAWCFPPDAPVTMADGSRTPISEVRAGDQVASRSGPRLVTRAALTKRDAEIWRLPLSDGSAVEATADHPVWVRDRGWVRLDSVMPGSTLEPCSSLARPHGSSTKVSVGTRTAPATTKAPRADSYTERSTPIMWELYRRISMFITSTKIRQTTPRITLSSSPGKNIWQSTGLEVGPLANTVRRRPRELGNGSGIWTPSNGLASTATLLTSLSPPTRNTAASYVKAGADDYAPICTAAASPTRRSDVYDLTIEGAHEFYAYGVLAHNCDEFASWDDADRSPGADSTTLSNLKMALRDDDGGTWKPRMILTTTPKSVRGLRNIDPDDELNPGVGVHDDPSTVVSNMSTYANRANLSEHFMETVVNPLVGTRLYEQEVEGKLIDAALGAQWSPELIDRMYCPPTYPAIQGRGFELIVIGVDPSVNEGLGDECGIVVSGLANDGNAYVLADLSKRCPAREWSRIVGEAARDFGADAVVVETNNGGELVTEVLGRDFPNLPIVDIHAKRGKKLRAEPVALLSDRGKVRLAAARLALSKLTHQMKTWTGDDPKLDSPDRLDAFVYSILYLLPPYDIEQLIKVRRRGIR